MAKKKKKEEGGGGSPAWMATFSDLMNLLLCFFVLLFSMSSVDSDKYEALLASLSGNFSVFTAGSSMVGDSVYVASGASQMVQISDYFTEYTSDGGKEGIEQFNNESEYEEAKKQEQEQATEKMLEEVSDKSEEAKLDGKITIEKDQNNQYVKISIGGALLFDSAKTELKKESLPILSKVGDILKTYDNHLIKIEGHTDNVPVSGGQYKNNMLLSMARAESVFDYLKKNKKMDPVNMEASGRGEYVPVANNKSSSGRARNRRVEFKIYTEEITE